MLQNLLGDDLQCRGIMTRSIFFKVINDFFKDKKWNSAHWPSQPSDLNPNEVAFQLLKVELKAQCPKTSRKEIQLQS